MSSRTEDDIVSQRIDPAKRPQRLPKEVRRRQIIKATIACLSRSGPEKWTLRQVSRDIGIAPSLVTYFFETWSELLVAAYRTLADRFETEFADIAERPGLSPDERVELYVDAYFSEFWMSDEIAGAYIAFWALARSEPALQAEMDRFSGLARAGLRPVLAAYADQPSAQAEDHADTAYFLLSGLWYEMAVNPSTVRPVDARRLSKAYLRAMPSR